MLTTYADASVPELVADDRAMIRYAVSWLPFGSGDEYIFPEFGITPAVFYHRIVLFIAAGYVDFLDSYTRDELRTFCTRKIALSKGESHVASLAG